MPSKKDVVVSQASEAAKSLSSTTGRFSALRAVRRVPVPEALREQILQLLRDRSLQPGDILPPEREFMQVFHVGRTTLREALAGLVAMGIVEVAGGKGYRIQSLAPPRIVLPELKIAQVAELFEARRILEVGMTELACIRATEEDFTALSESLEQILRARNARRSTAPAAARFHTALARAAHNGLLEKQLHGIRDLMVQVGATTERGVGSAFAEEQWEAHRLLLETLRTRDAAAMRAAMIAHLDRYAEEAGLFVINPELPG